MYLLNLIQSDELIGEYHSHHTLAKTLKNAADFIKGMPSTEFVIRREGKMVGCLTTNWKGELAEVEIWSPISSRITPINPGWDYLNQPAPVN